MSGALLQALVQSAVVAVARKRRQLFPFLDRLREGTRAKERTGDALFLKLLAVVRVRALLDDDERALARRETTNIGEALLSNNHLQCASGLVRARLGSKGENCAETHVEVVLGWKRHETETSQHFLAPRDISRKQTGLLWST